MLVASIARMPPGWAHDRSGRDRRRLRPCRRHVRPVGVPWFEPIAAGLVDELAVRPGRTRARRRVRTRGGPASAGARHRPVRTRARHRPLAPDGRAHRGGPGGAPAGRGPGRGRARPGVDAGVVRRRGVVPRPVLPARPAGRRPGLDRPAGPRRADRGRDLRRAGRTLARAGRGLPALPAARDARRPHQRATRPVRLRRGHGAAVRRRGPRRGPYGAPDRRRDLPRTSSTSSRSRGRTGSGPCGRRCPTPSTPTVRNALARVVLGACATRTAATRLEQEVRYTLAVRGSRPELPSPAIDLPGRPSRALSRSEGNVGHARRATATPRRVDRTDHRMAAEVTAAARRGRPAARDDARAGPAAARAMRSTSRSTGSGDCISA